MQEAEDFVRNLKEFSNGSTIFSPILFTGFDKYFENVISDLEQGEDKFGK